VDVKRLPLALVALVAILAVAGCGGGDDDSGGSDGGGAGGTKSAPNTTAIELPATLGSYKDVIDVAKSKAPNGTTVAAQEQRQANAERLTTAAYSAAFGGAASAFRSYGDQALEQLPSVIAVRAEAPGITFGPVVDPKDLRLAKPQNEVQKIGEVECLVFWLPVPEGQTPPGDQPNVRQCQRVGSGVTVFVYGSGFNGPAGVEAMAKLTDDAFAAVT
jgi:hypothetical protein